MPEPQCKPTTWTLLRLLDRLSLLLWIHLGVAFCLRAMALGRPDPYGRPMVGKLDWYLFHAVSLDALQALWLTVPPLLIVLAFWRAAPRIVMASQRLASVVLCVLLLAAAVLGIVDSELMRFTGTHLSPAELRTYVNPAGLAEVPRMLVKDAGGPMLGLLLLFLVPWLEWRWLRRAWHRPQPTGRPRNLASMLAFCLAGWLLVRVLWPGEAREWRLAPPLQIALSALHAAERAALTPQRTDLARQRHAERWLRGHPNSAELFAFPDLPLLHATPQRLCQAVAAVKLSAALLPKTLNCQADDDHDGAPLAQDCDDRRADVHLGAADVPGNGVDEDCSGLDAQPWNVLLLILETHRAVNVGHIFPGRDASTPGLDALAADGLGHTRAVANGTPTIYAFMAIHTGLLPHPDVVVATSFSRIGLQSLPELLRQHGYYTRFFSAADPAWDNQSAWLRRWYDDIDYDRSREEDVPMLAHVGEWMAGELPKHAGTKPFFATVMTRTNHFPFERIAGVKTTGTDDWRDRIRDTMGYTDAAMTALLKRMAQEPWMQHTIVIVTGDHAFPLGEHGPLRAYETSHVEAVGVPIVLWGGHPELAPWRGKLSSEPASHIDIAPTILDLLGIDDTGAWMGRSLVAGGQGEAITVGQVEWGIERGAERVLLDKRKFAPDGTPGPSAARLFDRLKDPHEDKPLPLTPTSHALSDDMALTARWMAALYDSDRIWPAWLLNPQR